MTTRYIVQFDATYNDGSLRGETEMAIKIEDCTHLDGTLRVSRDGIGLGIVYLPTNSIGRVVEAGTFTAGPFNKVMPREFDSREAAIAYLIGE